jgi:hypothetical protein
VCESVSVGVGVRVRVGVEWELDWQRGISERLSHVGRGVHTCSPGEKEFFL